ncbi:EamA family transporter [Kovacikia minuta CCNUW1]|uniref:DMT family transporter n=1 Tax=Kovacikia minuta TaxID=2931930 RepID=UPI001CCFE64A|nr:EamA family transporter [Kovacikia minuta]UBF25286.1 EamA family transporter [Kovacikia minuta CCNUW1]
MKLISYVFLLSIGIIWGAHFLFNEIAIRSIPPVSVAVGRAFLGAVTLTLLLQLSHLQRHPCHPCAQIQPTHTEALQLWRQLFIIALFEATLPFFLLGWGQQRIDSGHAAILMGTVPIMTVILAKFLIPDAGLKFGNLASISLGFVGVIVLVGSTSSLSAPSTIAGKLAILLAALSFSLSLILIKNLPTATPIRSARNVLFCASIQLIPIALIVDRPWLLRPPIESILSILFLGAACSGIAYMLYFALIQQNSPTFASFSNYLIPLFGTLFGHVFLHETVHPSELLALLMIITATVVNGLV